jgi:biopolymer transport protein ExbD
MAELDQNNGEFEDDGPKKQRKKPRAPGNEMGLNINSMMDIMTILLVFLLISITSDPLAIQQNSKMRLAKSTADFAAQNSIPITITADQILVDKKEAVPVKCITESGQQCSEADYSLTTNKYSVDKFHKKDQDATSFHIEPLYKKLKQLVDEAKQEVAAGDDKNKNRKADTATIVCHADIPYRIIAEVVYTAGLASLANLRFAILKTGAR